ncbi:DUF3310 domain-containing protein [Parvimonas micra]
MSNVEHPKHYQLSIDLEVLDVIELLLSKQKMHLNDYSYLVDAIKYLFIAEQKNGLENYKNALYYLEKTSYIGYPKYTPVEKMFINKILENVKGIKLGLIISDVISLRLNLAKHWLRKYIEEQEKQDEKL